LAVNLKLTMIHRTTKRSWIMQALYHSPHRKPLAAGILTAALLSIAAPSLAQHLTPPQPRQPPMAGEDDRRALNQEQLQFARAQLERNAASQAEYERLTADYQRQLAEIEATKSRIAADDVAARAAFEAEKARIESQHAAAMSRWQSDVAACRSGNYSRCSGG
jgi:hypothetical protein